jgi:Uncharacterized conserved protein
VFVDRIASAWLIRTFIDPFAEFVFVSSTTHRPASNEIRFDMFEAEFTHIGDRCTFEVLLAHFGLEGDAALRAIAEIVHDIDVKDGKFARPEASGIEQLLSGIARGTATDDARLVAGGAVFASLYESFRDSNSPETDRALSAARRVHERMPRRASSSVQRPRTSSRVKHRAVSSRWQSPSLLHRAFEQRGRRRIRWLCANARR